MYTELTQKILKSLFGEKHTIGVSEYEVKTGENNKNIVYIHIVPGKKYFAKVIGKEGRVINLIENLIKIKSYLNNCQAIIKVEK